MRHSASAYQKNACTKILETRKHTFFSCYYSVRKVGFRSPCFQFSTLGVFFSDCFLVKTHQDHWFLPSDCRKSWVCSKMMVLPPFSIGVPLKNHPILTLTHHGSPCPRARCRWTQHYRRCGNTTRAAWACPMGSLAPDGR